MFLMNRNIHKMHFKTVFAALKSRWLKLTFTLDRRTQFALATCVVQPYTFTVVKLPPEPPSSQNEILS